MDIFIFDGSRYNLEDLDQTLGSRQDQWLVREIDEAALSGRLLQPGLD